MKQQGIKERLYEMSFRELRQLIDYCLLNDANIESKHSSFITSDLRVLSKYIDVLESKITIPLQNNLPESVLPKMPTKPEILVETERQLNNHIELRSLALNRRDLPLANEYTKKITLLEKSLNTLNAEFQSEMKQYKAQIDLTIGKLPISPKDKDSYRIKSKSVARLRNELKNFNAGKSRVKQLNWDLLPKGKMPFKQFIRYVTEVSRCSESEIDYERYIKISSLNPDDTFCGLDEFKGYLVFYFEQLNLAILDCKKKGNAIYIFREDWKELSRLTKYELLNSNRNFLRIVHSASWFVRLQNEVNNIRFLKKFRKS